MEVQVTAPQGLGNAVHVEHFAVRQDSDGRPITAVLFEDVGLELVDMVRDPLFGPLRFNYDPDRQSRGCDVYIALSGPALVAKVVVAIAECSEEGHHDSNLDVLLACA
jgi:hypothetical protein